MLNNKTPKWFPFNGPRDLAASPFIVTGMLAYLVGRSLDQVSLAILDCKSDCDPLVKIARVSIGWPMSIAGIPISKASEMLLKISEKILRIQ